MSDAGQISTKARLVWITIREPVPMSFMIWEKPDVMAFVTELYRITKPGGRIKLLTPHYTNPDWANDPTHRNHLNSYSFHVFIPERQNFAFYTDVRLKPVRTYVSLLNLWRSFGIEFFVNLDQRNPKFRFTRKFWEHYLSNIFRGKELRLEFEVIKDQTAENTENVKEIKA